MKKALFAARGTRRVGVGMCFLALFLASCAHYRWGAPRESVPFQTLYVKPVANNAYVPQAQALLSSQLVDAFQQSGVEVVSCEDGADATLSVTLIDYSRTMAATQAKDAFLANSFYVTLKAQVTLIDNDTGEAYIQEHEVVASITALTEAGIQAIEYQDMPMLTRRLAHSIKDYVMTPW